MAPPQSKIGRRKKLRKREENGKVRELKGRKGKERKEGNKSL